MCKNLTTVKCSILLDKMQTIFRQYGKIINNNNNIIVKAKPIHGILCFITNKKPEWPRMSILHRLLTELKDECI
jgi:hypothetical protein